MCMSMILNKGIMCVLTISFCYGLNKLYGIVFIPLTFQVRRDMMTVWCILADSVIKLKRYDVQKYLCIPKGL